MSKAGYSPQRHPPHCNQARPTTVSLHVWTYIVKKHSLVVRLCHKYQSQGLNYVVVKDGNDDDAAVVTLVK